jgi:membrane protease YdiL (CAAX protease family)
MIDRASMVSATSLTDRYKTATEVAIAFAVATAVAAGLYRAQSIAFIHSNLHALVAATFLIIPQLALNKRADLEQYGFTSRPRGVGLGIAAVAIVGVLPIFAVAFVVWNRFLCGHLPQLVPGSCVRMLHPIYRLPSDFLMLAAAQLVVVALPEELFFRGYLQGRLEDAWPPTRNFLGAKLGVAWLVSAVLFGLGHFLVTLEPQMLTRVIPGLAFGWMYARTRSILAGTLFHAACNLLMDVLASSFL